MNQRRKTGCKGENMAAEFLLGKGYRIEERNWRFRHKEIDIIAIDQETLVIVEVKTRKIAPADYAEVLSKTKQKYLTEAAEHYIREKNVETEVRFDLILITLQGDSWKIDHLTDAFNVGL